VNVYDSSALLAMIFNEPGAVQVAGQLADNGGLVSAANLAEVVSKMWDQGFDEAAVQAVLLDLPVTVEPLSRDRAIAAGLLRSSTRPLGLSLGDRCCLALAAEHADAQIFTADRPWKKLKGFRVNLVR